MWRSTWAGPPGGSTLVAPDTWGRRGSWVVCDCREGMGMGVAWGGGRKGRIWGSWVVCDCREGMGIYIWFGLLREGTSDAVVQMSCGFKEEKMGEKIALMDWL